MIRNREYIENARIECIHARTHKHVHTHSQKGNILFYFTHGNEKVSCRTIDAVRSGSIESNRTRTPVHTHVITRSGITVVNGRALP